MATQERDPRAYELMTVFVPDISEEDTQAQVQKVSDYIANHGGTVNEALTDSPWGRRRLAYTIRFNGTDYRDGFYTVYHFDAKPSDLAELERELKLDVSVMRYLLVHDDPRAGEKPGEGESVGDEEAADQADQPAASAPVETEAPAATAEAAPASDTTATETSDEAPAAEAPSDASSDEATEATTEAEAAPVETEAASAEEVEAAPANDTAGSETETEDEADKE